MTEEQKTRAEQVKNEANMLFKGSVKDEAFNNKKLTRLKKIEKRFPEAIKKYTEAIELNDKVASYYTNRAFCHLKLESYGYAIA